MEAAPQPAQAAEDFVDSIGMCTHWGYPDTPYGGAYDTVKARLLESGIRHIRDGFSDKMIELGKLGIKSTVVTDADRSPAEWVDTIKRANSAGARIVAVEGPNEPDLFWRNNKRSYKGQGAEQGDAGIIAGVIAFQKDLYAAIKADPATAGLVVIGPSLGKTYGYDVRSPFGNGSLTDAVDWGNFHPYPGGNPFSQPFSYAGIEKYIWHGGQPTVNIDEFPYAFDIYAPPFAPKPMAATETGYSTFDGGTSERAQARYLPRLFAEYFRKGIRRTHSYEFADEFEKPAEREANFGLVRHDLTRKPAFTAMKNLIALLAEKAPNNNAPVPLDFDMQVGKAPGFDRTQYVHHLLLQKGNGEYCLLLWHEIALDDMTAVPYRRVPKAPPMPVSIKFSEPINRATLHDPGESTEPIQSFGEVGQVELGVPDRILVLRFHVGKK